MKKDAKGIKRTFFAYGPKTGETFLRFCFCVRSAREWNASVHILHISKPVIMLVLRGPCLPLPRFFTSCDDITWCRPSANTCLKLNMRCLLLALLLRVAKSHCFTTTRASFCFSTTLKNVRDFEGFCRMELSYRYSTKLAIQLSTAVRA